MRPTGWLALALAAGCEGGDDGKGADPTPTPTDPTTTEVPPTEDTGTPPPTTDTDPPPPPGPGEPTTLEVACAPTDNALRFECTVTVEPDQPITLTYVRQDGLSATRTVAAPGSGLVPVYFLAPEQAYHLTVAADAWPDSVATGALTTGAAPGPVASALAVTGSSTLGMIGTHLPCGDSATAVVYDTATGDLLWYQYMNPGGVFGALDMVVFTDEHTVLGESEGDVMEVDLMGADLVRLPGLDLALGVDVDGFFGNFHHDIAKHDGVYYVFYQERTGGGFDPDVLDVLILFDATGTELARWHPADHLDLPADWSGDYLHTNTVFVDPAGDIHLSWLSRDTVAKIVGDWTAPDFGEPIWMLDGNGPPGWGTLAVDWSGVDAPASFEDQHSVTIRPDGRLQLLDNRHGRGLVITVDEAAGTATVDVEYPTREGTCGPQGTSRSTLGGNAIVGCAGAYVREYAAAGGNPIWEAEVQCGGGGRPLGQGATRWYPLDGW